MGTHCAVAVKRGGVVRSWERTMDGFILRDVFQEWINGLIKTGIPPFVWDDPEVLNRIGGGVLEFGVEREHEQEYFVGVDYDNYVIYASPNVFLERDLYKTASLILNVYRTGWIMRLGYDDKDLQGGE